MANEDSYFLFDRPGPYISLRAPHRTEPRETEDETVVDAIAYLNMQEQHWDD